jgi:CRP-like cAMP-binding protein
VLNGARDEMDDANAKNLQRLRSLSAFNLSQLEKFAGHLVIKSYKKNEIIFDQDEEAKLVYLLISGVVRVSYLRHERQTIVSLVPGGEFFGLDSLIPKTEHPFRSEAFENSTVGSIKPQSFIEILLGTPYDGFLRWYTSITLSGRKSYIHCIRGIGLDLRRRIALELLNLADLFGTTDAHGLLIALSISHEDLAGIVGASRQQVTQHLNEFDREKIITREGRRIIVNSQKLRKIIDLMS